VHVPWCVRKCPYCDFNSHRLPAELDESRFVAVLLADLRAEHAWAPLPRMDSLFIGGGTPSVLSGAAVADLLDGIAAIVDLPATAEITLEANPGAVDAARFQAYRAAGINRLSIGVQSFSDAGLQALGRIHTAADAREALRAARAAGFDNINLDLMFGLPAQRCDDALRELDVAIACEPEHLSWYQLTLEPNTAFHHAPPALPAESEIAEMAEQGQQRLEAAGYRRYEVSAFASDGLQCRHNLNYWRFGDYAGIGPGAHGKRTRADGRIARRTKRRGPADYLAASGAAAVSREWLLDADDLVIEFMLNALRLVAGVPRSHFADATGLPVATIAEACARATERGLLHDTLERLQPTPLGLRYLNDLQALFLPD
jgi:oxygen-independent coproporphyrinogen-3 oxidase